MRYPGSKRKFKKPILNFIKSFYYKYSNPNMIYIEPFAGMFHIGQEVLKQFDFNDVILNDIDKGIYCYWNAIIEYPNDLIDKIEYFEPSVDKFFEFKRFFNNEINNIEIKIVDIAFKKIAIHQMSFSGLGAKSGGPIGGIAQKGKYKIDSRWNKKKIKKEIVYLNELCKNKINKCYSKDFSYFLNKSDNNFIYIDPPYYEKGEDLYQYAFNKKEHIKLAELLKNEKSIWLLSYDNNEQIKKMYDWANIVEISANYTIKTIRNKKELLITSKKWKNLLENINNDNNIFKN